MASQIQRVGATTFGYSDLQTQILGFTGAFPTSASVTGPVVVAIGTDGTVATAATNGTASLTIGVAINSQAATTGKACKVVILGIAENVPAAGAVSAGDLLKRSATTAGYVSATATPGAGEVMGVAINASSSNTVDVWVFPAKVTS